MKQLFALLLTLTICSAALAQTPSQINGAPVVVDVTGVVQSSPIDVFNYSLFPGSSTRYNTTSTISPAINYLDNGNLVVQCGSGTWTGVLPAIQALGTPSAITAGAYQQILYAPLTASISGSLVTCSGTGSITATTSTINGNPGSTSYPIPLGGSFFIFTDTSVPPAGNYVIVPLNSIASGGATLGANTFTGAQTIQSAGFNLWLDDTSAGTNGGWWNVYSVAGSGNLYIAASNDAQSTNHNGIGIGRISSTSPVISNVNLGNATDASIELNMYGMPVAFGTPPTVVLNTCSTSTVTVNGGTAGFDFLLTGSGGGPCGITVTWPIALAAANSMFCLATDVGQHTPVNQSNKASRILTFQTGSTTAATDDVQMQCWSH